VNWQGCKHYCSHGGLCMQPPTHTGLHNSGYCRWPSSESLTRDQADALVGSEPGGAEFLEHMRMAEAILDLFGIDHA
jgi:hypothetical protein